MRSRSTPKAAPAPAPAPAPLTPQPLSPPPRRALVALAIMAVTAFAHAPALWCGFLDLDDPGYITENRQVLDGLTTDGVAWAFTTLTECNWHPLTWLSLQLDVSFWGKDAFGFHLTNVFLHALTAGLLYLVLLRMTGSAGRSAVASLLFAVHPLRVESVTWASERKDVLSGLFWVLTMGAYAWYAAAPSLRRMLAVAGVFAVGLTAKPMLVTLPCALVLLDFWPLNRLASRADVLRRVGEKWPLFVLVVASSAVTFYAQSHGGATRDLSQRSVTDRVTGAGAAYAIYLRKTVAPVDLAVFYPHPLSPRPWWQLVGAAALLAAITAAAVRCRREAPYLPVGWFWYLGTLVPVIGLVQVGDQAYADRYTYIPHIGLALAAAWGLADLLSRARGGDRWGTGLAAVAVVAGVLATREQIDHWTSARSLWAHVLAVTEDNAQAELHYGANLLSEDRPAEAAPHFERSNQLQPGRYAVPYSLAVALSRLGRYEEAERAALEALRLAGNKENDLASSWNLLADISRLWGKGEEAAARYQRSLSYNSQQPGLRNNYATALAELGRTDEAIAVLAPAVEVIPNDPMVVGNFAEMLIRSNRFEEAVPHLRRVVEVDPKGGVNRGRLAVALSALGKRDEAVQFAREAAQLDPKWRAGVSRYAWRLATYPDAARRDGATAVRLAELLSAADERPDPTLLDVLAAAYAEVGRYDEAAATAARAAEAADRLGQRSQAGAIRRRAELYRARQPYRAAEG